MSSPWSNTSQASQASVPANAPNYGDAASPGSAPTPTGSAASAEAVWLNSGVMHLPRVKAKARTVQSADVEPDATAARLDARLDDCADAQHEPTGDRFARLSWGGGRAVDSAAIGRSRPWPPNKTQEVAVLAPAVAGAAVDLEAWQVMHLLP